MTLAIHPPALPDGAVSYPYDAALAGSGGHDPYELSLDQGALPPGLFLTGAVLSGTPTAAGNFSFSITMTDAATEVTSQAYSINVLPVLPTVTVEDGNVVPGANSYLGLDELYANQALLGISGPAFAAIANLSQATQSNLLVWGTAYLDRRFRFYGQAWDPLQTLQWPRTKNYDIRGFVIPPATIPTQLKQALALLTGAAAQNPQVMAIENTAFPLFEQSWTMDGVSITYGKNQTDGSKLQEGQVLPLFEQQIPDLQVLLRSIGELEMLDYVTTDKQTVVNR